MDIVYADNRIVVAVKPAGIISTEVPGGAPELLRAQLGTDCIRTVHRLDAQVSGLMVFARSAVAASLLSRQIREGIFHKAYLAVVHGAPPETGTLCDLLGRNRPRRYTFVAQTPGKGIREARLSYRVLDRREGYSLVSICLETGRTHQIRVQFASRGWHLVGDRKYGLGGEDIPIALWSRGLAFTHPETGAPLDFTLQPPRTEPWTWFDAALFSPEN
ncbi:MAG: RluA family pseudouridine synthase [Ruminococcaceae bacterium]|nr:RluA family pseudouridine synthase [Oscillospiraceae bacterium]